MELTRWQKWWMNSWWHRMSVRKVVPRFLKHSPEPIRGQVLEVGAGSGWSSRQILQTFPQVELTATDLNAVVDSELKSLTDLYGRRFQVKQANVLQLPFDREAFDISLAINALWVLPPSEISLALQELLRVTRRGGLVGITESSGAGKHSGDLVLTVLKQEGCDILYSTGARVAEVWARKPY